VKVPVNCLCCFPYSYSSSVGEWRGGEGGGAEDSWRKPFKCFCPTRNFGITCELHLRTPWWSLWELFQTNLRTFQVTMQMAGSSFCQLVSHLIASQHPSAYVISSLVCSVIYPITFIHFLEGHIMKIVLNDLTGSADAFQSCIWELHDSIACHAT
jgi:hypothetical protein